ncbi:MAG TPA: twin-arginine translocation signal domain-containing protein [Verrucomicrobiota bacterium]|nr:twin-arginine translocation signal domain-containing protein [Verrucomicrobiota bacterium]HRT07073.1 twin-arginine translocation signal domain-containing protein [Candidatus Paceibacterota bacterium]HRT57237.1 twin-arginine translocation signal domain-containing protein [Candidatus Paceibacterota bacterium]
MSRRSFLKTTAAGLAASGAFPTWAGRLWALPVVPPYLPTSKVRVAKVYLGRKQANWPVKEVDLEAEVRRFEGELAKLGPALADVEFVDGGVIGDVKEVPLLREKLEGVDGILAIHLTLHTGPTIKSLLDFNLPVVLFTVPYSGHEWHIVSGLQREGKLIEVLPSSQYADLAVAVRPFRAIHRLREARVLHLSQKEANADYVRAVRARFGTEIVSLFPDDLAKAYQAADLAEAEADAKRWVKEARKIVEPSRQEILKSSLMYVAMKNLMAEHRAAAITMNCLGMGLIDKGMGYPCLGFVRLNNLGLGGICEADLKSTMTHLIFSYLVGRPGFVTDPVFDLSNNTIIHAHCVAATQMEGPQSRPAPYFIRSHLEDNAGASLMVKMPVGRKLTMARLIGTDFMLFATGDAVDSPMVERGCRTKLTMRVENIEKMLHNWSCGLHRVVFYGDHTRDLERFCRFKGIRILREGVDDLQNVPGLEWETHIHA